MSLIDQNKAPERVVYSVSRLNRKIKNLLLDCVEPLWICGEISNLARPPSGHIYFSLKDESAQIRCVMFQSRNSQLKWAPGNGMLVLAYARLDLYANRGDIQLVVDKLEMSGEGDLQKRFEQLKKKLAQEGLFDQKRKCDIPPYPCRIGIISSPTSAAMADMMKVAQHSATHTETIVYPSLVQGKEAPASLIKALEHAEKRNEVEALIIARGGGSLEDLQAFNNEQLVRKIAQCPIPIISGVGHDIDFTLTDFVADLRTPTPTAAATALYTGTTRLVETLTHLQQQLSQRLHYVFEAKNNRLDLHRRHLIGLHPQARIQNLMQRFDDLGMRLPRALYSALHQWRNHLEQCLQSCIHHSPLTFIQQKQVRLEQQTVQLNHAVTQQLENHQQRLKHVMVRTSATNPLDILNRGYSIVTKANGSIVHASKQVKVGENISIRLRQGKIQATVDKTLKEK